MTITRNKIALGAIAGTVAALTAATAGTWGGAAAAVSSPSAPASAAHAASGTATPIKHVVVIFGENVSFDHYFGTYPHAANTDGTAFHAAPGTPTVNGLDSTALLTATTPNDGNPKRLGPSQAVTCDQDHGYTNEQ